MKRAHQQTTCGLKTLSFIELFLTSCYREGTLRIEMEQVYDDNSIDNASFGVDAMTMNYSHQSYCSTLLSPLLNGRWKINLW